MRWAVQNNASPNEQFPGVGVVSGVNLIPNTIQPTKINTQIPKELVSQAMALLFQSPVSYPPFVYSDWGVSGKVRSA